jgi:glycosyltransferase involved in cell wall biosynthesis
MKITIVLGAFLPVPPIMGGAIEKVWFALAPEFARRGHDIVVVSRAMSQFPRDEMINGVRHLRVRGFNTPRSLLWLKFLDLVYSRRTMSILPEADIVVTNTFWLPILLRNSKRGCVYVHVGRYPKGQMRFYKNAARLQAPSQAVARAIAAETPSAEDKIKAIPYPAPKPVLSGVEGTMESAPLPIQDRQKIILYVGRVHPEKGVHLLVDAFVGGTVSAEWQLMIVGPTEEKFGGGGDAYDVDLRRRAGKSNVVFHGPVFDRARLDELFRRARLFVYPSLAERGESFGLAALEAMTHGCAVLVSNLGCFKDFIRENETGFAFDHRSADPVTALRSKIDKIAGDETLLARVAEASYRESANYSLENVASQFLSDFESVIHAERTSR